ncbi:MAG TPA: MFS transporter [Bacteroidota bacterium]|nr:MFS transporter [Bacteroidota bacterium]
MSDTTGAVHEQLVFMKEKIGYAVGDTASCLYWQTFSMFLMIFYTDTFGISPAVVGTMFLISRFWDAAIDPVMGVIADRTETRHGKFRPWILWGIIPFTVSGIILFITPDFSETGKIVYAYVTYTVVMMVYTMVNVPYGALLGVISPHSDERTTLASFRFIGAFTGNIIVQGTLLYLVRFFGNGNDRIGYPLAMTVFAVAAGALFFYTFASTKERVKPPKEQSTVRRDIKDLLRNRPWIILCSMGLMTLIYVSIKNGAMLYYFKYYVGDQAAAAPFMVTGTVFSIIGALSTPYIVRFVGSKKLTFIVLTLVVSASTAVFYLAGPQDFVLMYATQIIGSVPGAAMFPLIWSMYADTADYGEWKFGRRATGLVFSAATFSQKMGWAVGGALAGFLLTVIGFVANIAQNEATLSGIRHMMSTIPAALALVVIVIAMFYELSAKLEKQIGADLQARKASAS